MHRSGTSAATLLLSRLGLSTPTGDDAMPPDENNRKGYFESRALAEVADDALRMLGATWDTPPRPEQVATRLAELEPLRERARQAVENVLDSAPWAWKDPRTCILLPFWQQVLPVTQPVLLVHRDPLEVADSLRRRNGFPLPYGLALWERYVRSSIEHARGRQVHVASYAALLADPDAWLASVRLFLEGTAGWDRLPDAPDLTDDLLEPAASPPSAARVLVTEQQAALAELLAQGAGTHGNFLLADLPSESPTTEPLLSLQRHWLAERVWRTTLEVRLEEQRSRSEDAARLREELQRAQDEAATGIATVRELQRERDALAAVHQDLGRERYALLAQRDRLAVHLEEQGCELERRSRELQQALRAQAQAEGALAAMRGSRSWRYTEVARLSYATLRARLHARREQPPGGH